MSRAEGSSPRVRGKRDHHRAHRRPRRLIPACAGKTLFSGRLGIRVAAHPRVCGENAGILGMKLLAAGSSPRVRGKHRRLPQPHRERGLIPACAGKTPVGGSPMRGCRAHPRVCGENDLLITHPGPVEGSSPRVRGKLLFFVTHSLHLRLIPACAGKTLQVRCRGHTTEAHPRVCGENARRPLRVRLLRGSSPRVRGKPGGAATARRRPGLIPACAGKTCGALLPRSGSPGSSPRVRGKLDIYLWLSHRLWLIPACAGKTRRPLNYGSPRSAHPRVCGENGVASGRFEGPDGSSPRVRGKPVIAIVFSFRAGLIPACAGKTAAWWRAQQDGEAHPRVCGENKTRPAPTPRTLGSSPRVRGKRWRPRPCSCAWGLIPACAGKTFHVQRLRRRVAAHPRVCGENSADFTMRIRDGGSSPRVRGKPRRRGRWRRR